MGSRARPGMFNTPAIRNGGIGALQLEAITNRPLSIARRHRAASQLRMCEIEPDELSSSEWVQFLVMEDRERERWMNDFRRRRRSSSSSCSSAESSSDATPYDKAEEARREAEMTRTDATAVRDLAAPAAPISTTGVTPAVSVWVRQSDEAAATSNGNTYSARRPMHAQRSVMDSRVEAPPPYETAVRQSAPPPAYEPREVDDATSPP